LTDFETTSLAKVFETVTLEASALGVQVLGSEIVGLVPRQALQDAAVQFLRIENFRPELIVENRLEQVVAQVSSPEAPQPGSPSEGSFRAMVEDFVNAVAAPTPTPGGGSAAALAGAMAAGLGEMVCGVSLKRKSLEAHHPALEAARARLASLRERLMDAVDRDPESYDALLRAYRLPKSIEAEQATRAQAIEAASKHASLVPLETAETAAAVANELANLPAITIPQAASDLSVASNLAETARRGGAENVRANIPGIRDDFWLREVKARLEKIGTRS